MGRNRPFAAASIRNTVPDQCDREHMVLPFDWKGRAELDGADYEFVGVSVYGVGRMVGRGESNNERCVLRPFGLVGMW